MDRDSSDHCVELPTTTSIFECRTYGTARAILNGISTDIFP
jgi:hypothetical protein